MRKTIKPPPRYAQADFIAFALNIVEDIDFDEPRSYAEAIRSRDWPKWQHAMQEEMESFEESILGPSS